MRKIIISVLAGILIIVGSIFAANYITNSKKSQRPTPNKVIKTVFVDTVKNNTVPILVAANGNLTAKNKVELYAEVQGVFRTGGTLFKTGQKYKSGQTLIRIDTTEYYASVQLSLIHI